MSIKERLKDRRQNGSNGEYVLMTLDERAALNRRFRRYNGVGKELPKIFAEFARLTPELNETSQMYWSEMTKAGLVAKAVFRGEPFVYRYFDVRYDLSGKVDELKKVNQAYEDDPNIKKIKGEDKFEESIGGISVYEIEQMPLPLCEADIKRIDKFFTIRKWNRDRQKRASRAHLLGLFATQKEARPEERIQIPTKLLPYYERIRSYFDYYTELLYPHQSLNELLPLLGRLVGNLELTEALGYYLPAKTGITPASTIKLLDSSLPTIFGLRKIKDLMIQQARESYREGVLPDDLERYQHYNQEADKRAEEHLRRRFFPDGEDISVSEAEKVIEDSDYLLQRVNLYWKKIHSDIVGSDGKRVKVAAGKDTPYESITVTCQNRKVLMFILHFRDGKTHLTLELDRSGMLYGMPSDFEKSKPLSLDLMIRDILTPTLEEVKKRHSFVEMEKETIFGGQGIMLPGEKVKVQGPSRKKRVKRNADEEEKNRGVQEVLVKKFRVLYSRKKVKDLMGKKVREKDVERVMRAIKSFEVGLAPTKIITWSEGRRYVVRVGDLRIILNNESGRFYIVEKVGHREEVYEGYADVNLS